MQSMTGYGAAEGEVVAAQTRRASWRWDARSFNGKGLDVRLRTPSGWERFEPDWRALAAARFQRGSITLTLSVAENAERAPIALNPAALAAAVAAAAHAATAVRAAGLPEPTLSLDGLLALKGVLGADAGEATASLAETEAERVTASLAEALDALAAARDAEGARLQAALAARLDEIAALADQAAAQAARRAPEQKARLKARVAALIEAGAETDSERLTHELALLAVKTDVAEEVERLRIHVASARELIGQDGPVGRKLDFLTQEFNREANTLCSKAQDAELTETGLALKVAIDQLREQAANAA